MKHGLLLHAADWPHSKFHRLVQAGVDPADLAGGFEENALIWQNEGSYMKQ